MSEIPLHQWEMIHPLIANSSGKGMTSTAGIGPAFGRLRVDGGWLYRTMGPVASGGATNGVALCFVPDPPLAAPIGATPADWAELNNG